MKMPVNTPDSNRWAIRKPSTCAMAGLTARVASKPYFTTKVTISRGSKVRSAGRCKRPVAGSTVMRRWRNSHQPKAVPTARPSSDGSREATDTP